MFTGLIEDVGEVVAVTPGEEITALAIRSPLIAADASLGASIAVSGVCLTVTAVDADVLTLEAMPQTLQVTTTGQLRVGSRVNLERAVRADTRLGGHIVQGHVDETAVLRSVRPGTDWTQLRFALPGSLVALVVDRGSITVEGVSLTVSAVSGPAEREPWFEVSLIPATLLTTTLGDLVAGDTVNVESDVLARHVERLLAVRAVRAVRSGLSAEETAR